MMDGSYTWSEINSQPEAWTEALAAFDGRAAELRAAWAALAPRQVAFTGCGSTHYLSQSAAFATQARLGVPARAYPGSEIALLGPQALVDARHTLLVAVSRSGTTTETRMAVERFREMGGPAVWSLTCYPDSPLARASDLVLAAAAAQEQSVAQTRSFSSMLVLGLAMAAALAGEGTERLHRLPERLAGLLGRVGGLARRLGADLAIDRLYFLGGGALYGLANEAMLKAKEMTLSHAEAYHPLEFRHGPMSMVTPQTLVVGLMGDTAPAQERRVLQDMQALGGRVLALAENEAAFEGSAPGETAWRPDEVVALHSGLPEWERSPLYLPVLQLMAYHRAVAKGLDPDRPHNLTAVVTL
jgi:glucosamine--fructose-6-phosphate aminotransferase (isomerizing)